jgi:hypothetical protein
VGLPGPHRRSGVARSLAASFRPVKTSTSITMVMWSTNGSFDALRLPGTKARTRRRFGGSPGAASCQTGASTR